MPVFKKHKVMGYPTVIVFDKGKQVKRHTGIVKFDELVKGMKTRTGQEKPDDPWYEWLKLW